MFQCENCWEMQAPCTPVNRIVTERRNKIYEKVIRKHGKVVAVDHVDGWEIVKELEVCPRCFQILTGKTPKTVRQKPITPSTQPPPNRRAGRQRKTPEVVVVNQVQVVKG